MPGPPGSSLGGGTQGCGTECETRTRDRPDRAEGLQHYGAAVLAMHSSLARPRSSLPIARAITCHRCHLSAGIETASYARSTTIGTPIGTPSFTANPRPGHDPSAQTEHKHPQFATRRHRWQGSSRAVTFRPLWVKSSPPENPASTSEVPPIADGIAAAQRTVDPCQKPTSHPQCERHSGQACLCKNAWTFPIVLLLDSSPRSNRRPSFHFG
jgi:hypothetical protein